MRVLPVKIRKLTFGAMMLALALVFLALAAMFPAMDLTLCAAASVCVALTVARCGLGYGTMTYAAATLLAFVLTPASAVIFALAFGPYPLYRRLCARIRPVWLRWAVKLVIANALVLLAYWLFRWAFADVEGPLWQMAGLLVLYNIVMVLYDKATFRVETMLTRRFLR